MDLRQRALELLSLADPLAKASGTRQKSNGIEDRRRCRAA
jgi:hypothetical protein